MKKLLAVVLLTLSCATSSPQSLEDLDLGEYSILRGNLVGEPVFENGGKRMFIYLEVGSEENEKEVFICMALNEDKRTVLADLKDRLLAAVGEVYIYAIPNEKAHEEIIAGVDYIIIAVGFYIPQASKYQYRLANYNQSTRQAIRNIRWGSFLKKLGKAVINKAF